MRGGKHAFDYSTIKSTLQTKKPPAETGGIY